MVPGAARGGRRGSHANSGIACGESPHPPHPCAIFKNRPPAGQARRHALRSGAKGGFAAPLPVRAVKTKSQNRAEPRQLPERVDRAHGGEHAPILVAAHRNKIEIFPDCGVTSRECALYCAQRKALASANASRRRIRGASTATRTSLRDADRNSDSIGVAVFASPK